MCLSTLQLKFIQCLYSVEVQLKVNSFYYLVSGTGVSSGCHTPTSHLSSSSTSLTASVVTPTSTHPPHQSQQVTSTTNTLKSTDRESLGSQAIATSTSPAQNSSPQLSRVSTTTQGSELTTNSAYQHNITTESPIPRHPVAVLQHTPHQTGVPLTSSAAVISHLVPVQQTSMLVSSSHDGQVIYSQGVALITTRGEVITSPTSPTSLVSSPHLPSSVRPSINSPSPTLSGTTTPHSGYILGTTGYPSSQLMNMAPPYSPIPTYPYFGSPLASPVPSPKTPKMYGSYNAVNRAPSEQDSLFKWLKALRLHKYHSMFENVTFDEVCVCVCVCVHASVCVCVVCCLATQISKTHIS